MDICNKKTLSAGCNHSSGFNDKLVIAFVPYHDKNLFW